MTLDDYFESVKEAEIALQNIKENAPESYILYKKILKEGTGDRPYKVTYQEPDPYSDKLKYIDKEYSVLPGIVENFLGLEQIDQNRLLWHLWNYNQHSDNKINLDMLKSAIEAERLKNIKNQ